MWEPSPGHPLRRMFAGLTEHAFIAKFGVADPPLTDYLSTLLSRFVHLDAVHALPNGHGRPMTELVEMLMEAEGLPEGGRTRRDYFQHIGDFTLFWTGVFPESLAPQRLRGKADALINYAIQGRRSYRIASELSEERGDNDGPVLRRISEQFDLCAVGLREVRREWEAQADEFPAHGLIR